MVGCVLSYHLAEVRPVLTQIYKTSAVMLHYCHSLNHRSPGRQEGSGRPIERLDKRGVPELHALGEWEGPL